jgi:hypothetical protein
MATELRNFVNNLEQVVNQAKMEQSLSIARGSLPDFNAYCRACGRVQGMETVVGLAKDMLNKMRDMEEKDQLPEMPKTGTDT